MDHFTLNLRPKEYFQLAPNMRTAYIELCIYLISKSVTYRPGRLSTLADRNQSTRFPQPRAKYYIHSVVGQRSMDIYIRSSVNGLWKCALQVVGRSTEGIYGIRKYTVPPPARRQEGRRIIKNMLYYYESKRKIIEKLYKIY